MVWTELTRRQHGQAGDKYASDLTDVERALPGVLMSPGKTTGRPDMTCLRALLVAILYIVTTGCQWCILPCSGAHQPENARMQRPVHGNALAQDLGPHGMAASAGQTRPLP